MQERFCCLEDATPHRGTRREFFSGVVKEDTKFVRITRDACEGCATEHASAAFDARLRKPTETPVRGATCTRERLRFCEGGEIVAGRENTSAGWTHALALQTCTSAVDSSRARGEEDGALRPVHLTCRAVFTLGALRDDEPVTPTTRKRRGRDADAASNSLIRSTGSSVARF